MKQRKGNRKLLQRRSETGAVGALVARRSSSKISMARDLAAFRSVSDRSSYPSTRRCGSAPFGFQDHARDLAVFGWVAVAFGCILNDAR